MIEQYSAGLDFKKFSNDFEAQDAIVRRLEIIGEASNRVPADLKDKFPEIPWKQMLGMRNIIVHDYMYIDLQKVWSVVADDLPGLKKSLQNAVAKI